MKFRWLRRKSLAALHGASSDPEHGDLSTTRNSPSRVQEFFSASIASTWTASPACKPKSYSTPPWRNPGSPAAAAGPYRTARNIHVIHSRRPQEIRARTATPERSRNWRIPVVARPRPPIAGRGPIALGLLLAVNLLGPAIRIDAQLPGLAARTGPGGATPQHHRRRHRPIGAGRRTGGRRIRGQPAAGRRRTGRGAIAISAPLDAPGCTRRKLRCHRRCQLRPWSPGPEAVKSVNSGGPGKSASGAIRCSPMKTYKVGDDELLADDQRK